MSHTLDPRAARIAQFRQDILSAMDSASRPALSGELAEWLHRTDRTPRSVPGGPSFDTALAQLVSDGNLEKVFEDGAFSGQSRTYYWKPR